MTKTKAIEIVKNLNKEDYTPMEKFEAIVDVSNMDDHKSITKADLVEMIRYLTVMIKIMAEGEPDEPEKAE